MINYSIIIPHYNSYNLLDLCLSSIPKRKDIQVIVVDDHSDTSLCPDDNYWNKKKSQYDVIISPEGKGAGHARNMGLKIAKGKWIIFADADDTFSKNAFDYFDKYLDCDSSIIYFLTSSSYIDNRNEIASEHVYFNSLVENFNIDDKESETKLRLFFVPPWGKMFSKDLIKNNDIEFEEIRFGNDVMFSIRTALMAKKVQAEKNVVYNIIVTKGSLTRIRSLESLKTRYLVALRRNKLYRDFGFHKYQKPIMSYLRRSLKYGISTLLDFLILSVKYKCNPLIGCSSWPSNIVKILFHKNTQEKYILKE